MPQFVRQPSQYLILVLLSALLSACVTKVSEEAWPSELPARQLFVDAWEKQRQVGHNSSPLEQHLVWIRRFYEGSVLYPIGWNDMTESVLESLPATEDQSVTKNRLYDLGLLICIEWAQDNKVRKIDSSNVAVWGNALRTAVEQNQQLSFLELVEKDVAALLDGTLKAREIERERYYPPQDYDNF